MFSSQLTTIMTFEQNRLLIQKSHTHYGYSIAYGKGALQLAGYLKLFIFKRGWITVIIVLAIVKHVAWFAEQYADRVGASYISDLQRHYR